MDKFKETGLTPIPAQMVKAPLVEESPVNIECRLKEIVKLGSHDMFIAQVLGVNVDTKYLNEKGKFELSKSKLVAYSHGEYYGLGDLIGTFGYSVRKEKKSDTKKKKKK